MGELTILENGERAALLALAGSVPGVVDDFWEEHVLNAAGYDILMDGEQAGYCRVQDNGCLTAFHMEAPYEKHARAAFELLLSRLVRSALVSTRDAGFLDLCLDFQQKIEMQAYFFTLGAAPVRAPEYPRALLRLAVPGDERVILDTEGVTENIRAGRYYVLEQDGVFLGQGFFNPLTLRKGFASIGMATHPDYLRRGVGRSIIMHLTDLCREKNLTPVCGCWYYNHNSRRTLMSAGYVPATRYLNVTF